MAKNLKMKKVTSRHAVWSNKKFKTREYRGHYEYRNGERAFALCAVLKNGKKVSEKFESHEAAKKLGWSRK